MALRRGFKTESNERAREFRVELGLAPHAPLSPWALASHLGIPLMRLSELASIESAAVTLFDLPCARRVFSGRPSLRGVAG
jgi:hypothetical protein